MSARRVGTAVFALAAMLIWLPAQADAQQEQAFVEARGGVGLGLGDIGYITDGGPSFGVEFGYWVHERVAVTIGGDASFLRGADQDLSDRADSLGTRVFFDQPDMDFYSYTAGLQLLLTDPAEALEVRLGGGVGASTITTDQFPSDFVAGLPEGVEAPEDGEFSDTRVTVQGNLLVGYDVSPRFNVFAGTRPYLAFTDEDTTQFFHEAVEEADERGFGTAWHLPLHVGVKIGF